MFVPIGGDIGTFDMNYPMKSIWFDSVWPNDERGKGHFVLVPIHRHTDIDSVSYKVKTNPETTYLFLVEEFIEEDRHVANRFPEEWNRMPPDGIPRNVWIGASVKTQEEVDERLPMLMKMRARKLFVVTKRGREKVDLTAHLAAWRCRNCGRKGKMPRPLRCPTGTLCMPNIPGEPQIEPQIHWVIDMDPGVEDLSVTRESGVALWNGTYLEIPE